MILLKLALMLSRPFVESWTMENSNSIKLKRKKNNAKKQKQVQIKEIKFRPGTDEGDYQVKLRNLIRFLEGGDKAKVTLRFRGREMAHQEIGLNLLNRIRDDLDELASVESFPKMEGRQAVMVLAPKKK